jgi:hypothetical protein
MEDDLGIVEPWMSANMLRVDGKSWLPAQLVEVHHVAVVHEQPVLRAEGVAVGLLHR